MKSLEQSGRTVEEAIHVGLQQMKVDLDAVEIEVLEEGNKGLFGLVGSRPARVKISLKEDFRELPRQVARDVLNVMGILAEIHVREDDDHVFLTFEGPDLGVLIGRRGETLNALQYLINLIVNKRLSQKVKVVLDVEGYRERREEALSRLAASLSEKAKKTGRQVVLEPMSPYERRIIHMTLQNSKEVATSSEGEEPFRKVVIVPKR